MMVNKINLALPVEANWVVWVCAKGVIDDLQWLKNELKLKTTPILAK